MKLVRDLRTLVMSGIRIIAHADKLLFKNVTHSFHLLATFALETEWNMGNKTDNMNTWLHNYFYSRNNISAEM